MIESNVQLYHSKKVQMKNQFSEAKGAVNHEDFYKLQPMQNECIMQQSAVLSYKDREE